MIKNIIFIMVIFAAIFIMSYTEISHRHKKKMYRIHSVMMKIIVRNNIDKFESNMYSSSVNMEKVKLLSRAEEFHKEAVSLYDTILSTIGEMNKRFLLSPRMILYIDRVDKSFLDFRKKYRR